MSPFSLQRNSKLHPLLITSAAASVIVGLLFILLILTSDPLSNARPATCLATHCFCEKARDGLLRQPVNTLTSLTYTLLGLWTLGTRAATKRPKCVEAPMIASIGWLLIFIGSTSFFYHATLTFLGQFLDIFSMYLLGTLFLVGALLRRSQVSLRVAILSFLVMNTILAVVQYEIPEARRYLFALLLLPGIAFEFSKRTSGYSRGSRELRAFYSGFGLLFVGYGFWIMDQNQIACWPTSIWQGHGIWHILTAFAAYMIVRHYHSTAHTIDMAR